MDLGARVQIQGVPIYESLGGLWACEYAHAYLSRTRLWMTTGNKHCDCEQLIS